jgi:hypothetical protein
MEEHDQEEEDERGHRLGEEAERPGENRKSHQQARIEKDALRPLREGAEPEQRDEDRVARRHVAQTREEMLLRHDCALRNPCGPLLRR